MSSSRIEQRPAAVPEYEPQHQELVEQGRRLREELGLLRAAIAARDHIDPEMASMVPMTYTPEQYDAAQQRREAEMAQFAERIASLETARTQLLADWEALAARTLVMYTQVSVPSAGELFPQVVDAASLDRLRVQIEARQQGLGRASWITKLLSRAHRRAELQVATHVQLMQRLQEEHTRVAGLGVMEEHPRVEVAAASLDQQLQQQLRRGLLDHFDRLVERERPLHALATDPEFLARMDAQIEATEISPFLEQLRGARPTPERDAQCAAWGAAYRQLLTHAANDFVDPQAWTGPTYGSQERALRESLQRTYLREGSSFQVADAADQPLVDALQFPEARIAVRLNGDPRAQTSDLVQAFLSWRLRASVAQEMTPCVRPGTKDVLDGVRRRLEDTTVRWLEHPETLNEHLGGIRRWRMVREDPAFQQHATPAECDAFADFLVDTLIDKIIRPGGRESWAGTTAARLIRELGNVHALPRLLEHLFASGSGHTNAVVCGVMEELADTPEGRAAIAEFPPVTRHLFEQLNDPKSVLQQAAGKDSYAKTWLMSRGEIFLAQSALAHCFPEKSAEYSGASPRKLFLNGFLPETEVRAVLRAHREEVERAVLAADDTAPWWAIPGCTTIAAERPEFLQEVVARMPQVSEAQRARLADLVAHRKARESSAMRGALLQGVLALRASGAMGAQILGQLADRYQGAKDDPSRARRLLRYTELLHRFDVLFADYDAAARRKAMHAELETLSQELAPFHAQREALRKRRRLLRAEQQRLGEAFVEGMLDEKNRAGDAELAQVEQELQELEERTAARDTRAKALRQELPRHATHGLAGMVEHYQERVSELLQHRLGIAPEVGMRLAADLDAHLESGLVDIATTLLLSYEAKHAERQRPVLQTIVVRIVMGDFAAWRYTHERASAQLSCLAGDARGAWIKNDAPVTMAADVTGEENTQYARTAALRFLESAKTHAREEAEQAQRGARSGSPGTFSEHATTITRLLHAPSVDVGALQAAVLELQSWCNRNGFMQVASDCAQIVRPFLVPEVGAVCAEEFDDPIRLLKIGTEPAETCQSWKRGMFNECLLSYVADANVKGMCVTGERGAALLRCVARVVPSTVPGTETSCPALVLEPPYAISDHPRLYRALARLAVAKASAMGAVLRLPAQWPGFARDIIVAEAEAMGARVAIAEAGSITLPESYNGVLYSDSFGGRIEPHGQSFSMQHFTEITPA